MDDTFFFMLKHLKCKKKKKMFELENSIVPDEVVHNEPHCLALHSLPSTL